MVSIQRVRRVLVGGAKIKRTQSVARIIGIAGYSACVMALAAPSAAMAHHSFAMYDSAKLLSLTGTVTEWSWANPHISLTLLAKGPAGETRWLLTGQAISTWARLGMHGKDVAVGDKVSVQFNPARDGGPSGYIKNITLASGRTLGEAPAPTDKPRRDSLANPLEAPH